VELGAIYSPCVSVCVYGSFEESSVT